MEKQLTYKTTNSYSVLNERTDQTLRTWVVFHGIGYLSRYFLKYFRDLPPAENFILAPQAPSLYYLNDSYKHVGACWLTREQTHEQMQNLLHYLDQLWEQEGLAQTPELILMGYSQGVSVLSRWMVSRKISCSQLILWAGRVPEELNPDAFIYLPEGVKIQYVYGENDPYIAGLDTEKLRKRLRLLFGERLQIKTFGGGHEIRKEVLAELIS
ncbi:alpha/beta hydrolase [Robiginitalea sp. IMCC44478]|uniref:alpha/beta hydrolase n=1 Tax=Robiginitalea sp. IMCC44478 TaxID=3459122 RepID=UPI0040416839